MDGLKGVAIEERRKPRRIYIRNHSKKVRRIVEEAKKVKRVLGWPEQAVCKICYGRNKQSVRYATRRKTLSI